MRTLGRTGRSAGYTADEIQTIPGSARSQRASATLADILAGCATRVSADACSKLFAASTPPRGSAPTDTLTAAQSIARNPWHQPERLFALLDQYYPVPQGKNLRGVPFMPYLKLAPSAWVLPLKFDGGGYRAGGKAMFDSEGNLWVGDNFTVGWQGQDSLWEGHATKFAPNGRPLSPMTTGTVHGLGGHLPSFRRGSRMPEVIGERQSRGGFLMKLTATHEPPGDVGGLQRGALGG